MNLVKPFILSEFFKVEVGSIKIAACMKTQFSFVIFGVIVGRLEQDTSNFKAQL